MKTFFRVSTGMHGWLVKKTGKMGGGTKDGSVLVLTHQGAKSGKIRAIPLMFMNIDEGYAVTASMGGAPSNPGWYYNLRANPDTTIHVAGSDIPVRARLLEGAERDDLWSQFVELNDRYGGYASKTDRVIPVFILETKP